VKLSHFSVIKIIVFKIERPKFSVPFQIEIEILFGDSRLNKFDGLEEILALGGSNILNLHFANVFHATPDGHHRSLGTQVLHISTGIAFG
jgi:hypothetical protein